MSLLLSGALLAQTYEVGSANTNRLFQDGVPVVNTPTISGPQFAAMGQIGGGIGPVSNASALPERFSSNEDGSIILKQGNLGWSFASGVPRYSLGDIIQPPLAIYTGESDAPADYWRVKPLQPGEILKVKPAGSPFYTTAALPQVTVVASTTSSSTVTIQAPRPADLKVGATILGQPIAKLVGETGVLLAGNANLTITNPTLESIIPSNSYYYSPHGERVVAHQPGRVEITWVTREPVEGNDVYGIKKEIFAVSANSSQPVKTIYWTEAGFDGPTVPVRDGRVSTVNPLYNQSIPKAVGEEISIPGFTPQTPNLKTLYYEKISGLGELKAYNTEGRVVVEYLGGVRLGDDIHEFLGLEVIDVKRSPDVQFSQIYLGQEIVPHTGDTDLIPSPLLAVTQQSENFYATQVKPDNSLAYYAERVTSREKNPDDGEPVSNDAYNKVVFYWLEEGEYGTEWPAFQERYWLRWSPHLTDYEHYSVSEEGSDAATGIRFGSGTLPQLVFQDDPDQVEARIEQNSQRFVVDFEDDNERNRALLKFNSGSEVWYVNVYTQAEERVQARSAEVAASTQTLVYVPTTQYLLVGDYVASYSFVYWGRITSIVNSNYFYLSVDERPENAGQVLANGYRTLYFYRNSLFSSFYGTLFSFTNNTYEVESVTVSSTEGLEVGMVISGEGVTGSMTVSNILSETEIEVASSGPVLSGNYAWNFTVESDTQPPIDTVVSVGSRLSAPFGHELGGYVSEGTAYQPAAYLDPFLTGVETANTGAIIPVNARPDDNRLHVRWFRKVQAPGDSFEPFYVPGKIGRYTLQYPTDAPVITIAQGVGTGDLPSEVAAGDLYYENESSKTGYNPNEEHALMLGGRAYALREDLNVTTGSDYTSEPYVLISYLDSEDQRPAMAVYRVQRESHEHRFDYPAVAGNLLVKPYPLPLMPLPLEEVSPGKWASKDVEVGIESPQNSDLAANQAYEKFTFQDRKGFTWVHRGPHQAAVFNRASYFGAGGSADVSAVVRSFVDNQTGFEVNNGSLGVDPSPNLSKTLRVFYQDESGREAFDDFPEFATFVPRALPPTLTVRLYYPFREGFFLPGHSTQPASGTVLPFLRSVGRSGSTLNYGAIEVGNDDEPLLITYRPQWPLNAPKLRIGETLTLPKFGLPQVRGQLSSEILYQQSLARDDEGFDEHSVLLHDPTREKTYPLQAPLTEIPGSVKTSSYQGKVYFQRLPAHLQQRFYLDPLRGSLGTLVLIGEFHDVIAGEDYLDLNVLSTTDREALKDLVLSSDADKSAWDSAIDALATEVETFRENPSQRGTYEPEHSLTMTAGEDTLAVVNDDDTAVDSYAVTASGKGSGFVTMIFGNGEAFTPEGDPVQVKVLEVEEQLYVGDLKVVQSENPLDEQVSLRHSGDFAAKLEDYEFDWRWTTAAATAPATYLQTMERRIGDSISGTHLWKTVVNPEAALPNPSSYLADTPIDLPRGIEVKSAGYTELSASTGYPTLVLKSESGVDFTNGVPGKVVFSAQLGEFDGFVLYVNGVEVLAHQAPAEFFESAGSVSGLTNGGLSKQFEVPSSFFTAGANTVEVALYSEADAGAVSGLDFVLEAALESDEVDKEGSVWQSSQDPTGRNTNIAVVGGSPLNPFGGPQFVINDRWFTMRYRPKANTGNLMEGEWSRWMPPQYVEGWVKRVLAAINPFEQRVKNLYENAVNSDVSVLTQAGTRWEGDIALTLDNVNDAGLIEIYETVLNRARSMSIDANVNDPDTNLALLLVAGYLNDLYTLLGNEAYADAANPTISVDGGDGATEVNSSRFAFESQVATSLEEELALLRGRDDFVSPGVRTAPAYNRLYWNYTRGIDGGEVIYAVNYNIREKAGSDTADGVIDEADAQRMFPQGHGDAYGHYLTGLKGYYRLLQNDHYDWNPRAEVVTVLGQPITIDYQDERKFAGAAANLARTAQEVIELTFRESYEDDPALGWDHFRDDRGTNLQTGITRHQGLDEWVSRSTQGAYYNWAVANAMLPAEDTVNEGIQKIDRTTVPEITQLATYADSFQTTIDDANAHLNPLGLNSGAVAFDISPAELEAGNSHFEQVYGRAVGALNNAVGAFDRAAVMTRALRDQESQLDDFDASLAQQELAYKNRLIEIFGTPYDGEIGPGKLYTQGYDGPDLLHWFIVDQPNDLEDPSETFEVTIQTPKDEDFGFSGSDFSNAQPHLITGNLEDVSVTVQPSQFVQYNEVWSADTVGSRAETGSLQNALLESQRTYLELLSLSGDYEDLRSEFERSVVLFKGLIDNQARRLQTLQGSNDSIVSLNQISDELETTAAILSLSGSVISEGANAVATALPTTVGLSNDPFAPGRGASLAVGTVARAVLDGLAIAQEAMSRARQNEILDKELELTERLTELEFDLESRQAAYELENLYLEHKGLTEQLMLYTLAHQRALQNVRNVLAQGNRVLAEREIFRQRAAAVVQGYRTNDLSFRLFRNEALEQYRALFDLAGRYSYLAAKSYDYETGLLGTDTGREVFDELVSSRALGDLTGGVPNATTSTLGDSGLAGTMARLAADFSVAEGRLGINNPDEYGTVFSLRKELFRIQDDPAITADDEAWRQRLELNLVPDLMADPDVVEQCRNIARADGGPVPGLIISFNSTIEQGKNFFGLPLAGGDHAYSPSSFATKIHSAGISLPGYVGMDPYASGTVQAGVPAGSSPDALSATPYLYLIPCGTDYMLAPPLGDTNTVRAWNVQDQAFPLPFNLGASDFNDTQFLRADGTLTEQPWILRKHQAFRPVADASFFYSRVPNEFTNTRLVGRSVWNSQWKIVIPGYTLLADEHDGLDRFMRSVSDIELFFRTYSHSGN